MAQDYLETRGIPFLYCLNPAKTTVYARYLSDGYTYENKFNTAMLEALERYGVNYIENVSLLTEKSMDEQVYNVKYDAGHWNVWNVITAPIIFYPLFLPIFLR